MVAAGVGMLVLLILLRRKVLIKRANKALRMLSVAYFFLLPVAAGYFGFQWGFLRGLRDDLRERAAAGGFGGTACSLMLRFSASGFVERSVKSKLRDFIASVIGSDGTAEAIISAKLFTLLDEGLFAKIIVFEINAVFKSLMRGVLQLFGLLLLPPLLEIVPAHHLLRRKLRAARDAAALPAA